MVSITRHTMLQWLPEVKYNGLLVGCLLLVSEYDPKREETSLLTVAPGANSNQATHPRSLNNAFVICMTETGIICYPKCTQLRFRSDCANAQSDLNLHWAHMSVGTFSDIVDNEVEITLLI